MVDQELTFRCIVYREEDLTFTGVCLDLDIVEEGFTTMEQAVLSLQDAVETHVKAATKLGSPSTLLNRPAPQSYWDKLEAMTVKKPKQRLPDLFQLFNAPVLTSSGRYA